MNYKAGRVHYGIPVGVLCLESYFPKPPGHVRNPLSFRFPTVCHVVKGIDVPRLLFSPSPDLLGPFLEGARQLEKDGVKAIVGSCGFMALFQKELSESVRIPVAASSLAQLPLMRLMHGKAARIGVLTASARALTPAHFAAVGVDMAEYYVKGMEEYTVFADVILKATAPEMDAAAMEEAICDAAAALCGEHGLDALLLECTDLSAFALAVQRRLDIPVYDINSLVEYIAYSVNRIAYPAPGRACW